MYSVCQAVDVGKVPTGSRGRRNQGTRGNMPQKSVGAGRGLNCNATGQGQSQVKVNQGHVLVLHFTPFFFFFIKT